MNCGNDNKQPCACGFSAEEVAEALIRKVKDPDVAQEIMDVWGSRIDQQLGKGLRRFGLYMLIALMSVGSLKLGIVERMLK